MRSPVSPEKIISVIDGDYTNDITMVDPDGSIKK